MALPQHFLDELLARTDIVELVSRYVPLKRKGGSMWGCCPFHHEKTPSFHVEQDKQFYKCFGCGEGGNAIQFLIKIENLPYIDAVRKLAEMAGMELPEEEDGGKSRLQRQRLLALNKDAARYFYDTLAGEKGREALQYLLNRGMTPQTIVRFGLGYAEDDWDSFLTAMRKKGYTDMELETAKLAGRTRNGKLYPFFRGRVMFPIIDIRGDVVAFGGRVIKGDGDGRKYINSSDTPVYSKSRTLYAMNLAKKSKAGRFILCEGNIDVIALHQAGFDSAVASCGTAFTAEQARLLSKYTSEVVICYDADAAGLKATEKAIDILKQNGLNVRVLRLPPKRDKQGKVLYDGEGRPQKVDPDDFIRQNGPEAFARLLDKPQTDGQYRMGEIRKKYGDLNDAAESGQYISDVKEYLCTIASKTDREMYAAIASKESGRTMQAILDDVNSMRQRAQKKRIRQEEADAQQPIRMLQPKAWNLRYKNPKSASREEWLLRMVLSDVELLEVAQVRIDPEMFSSEFLSKVYKIATELLDGGFEPTVASCMEKLTVEENQQLTNILSKSIGPGKTKEELLDLIDQIKAEYEKNDPSLDEGERAKRLIERKRG